MSLHHAPLTDELIGEIQEAFSIFNVDNSGAITFAQIKDVMQSLGQSCTDEQLVEMIAEVDTKGNGTIDFPEFLNMMTRRLNEGDAERELREVFSVFDRDNSGYITANNLRHVISHLGDDLDESELREMIREADSDGDGKITYEDFAQIMRTK